MRLYRKMAAYKRETGLSHEQVAAKFNRTKGVVSTAIAAVKAERAEAAAIETARSPLSGGSEPEPPAEPAPEPEAGEIDPYQELLRSYLGLQDAVRRAEEAEEEALAARLRRDMFPLLRELAKHRPDDEKGLVKVDPVAMATYAEAALAKLTTVARRIRAEQLELLQEWLADKPTVAQEAAVDCLRHVGVLPQDWSAPGPSEPAKEV